ncbi:Conserved_hypothetical protein [Hexamita inflata]|uniref:Uncharacterized protein n=2 Tax=Hexamita inflata TaxID=28002 RepID=A0AA86RHD8_9EUKA|nr:Conserved hypothetical protein [Hexamita inflata]
MFSLKTFAVFGFSDNSHVIDGGLINVSLNINVSQAALICMQCQLSISNSQLVFIASGHVMSAVALQVHQEIQLLNTSVQYRFQSLQAAGFVSIISESIYISLVNVKMNGYNSEQSQNSGYFVSKLAVSTLLNIDNLQVCANEDKAVGSGIDNLQLNGAILSSCQSSCYSGSLYSYGICVQQLQHGEMIDNTFVCIYPFEFDCQIAQCVCRNWYILNISYCIPIVISITNLDTTMHDINSQTNMVIEQQKQYLEQMINGNISLIDQYLDNNVSILNALISQELADVEYNLNNNVSMIQSYLKNNISDVQTMIASNRSIVESQVANNISQLQDKIYFNITDLNNTVQLEIQQVNQSTTQIASDLLDLKSNVQQIVVDQNINNFNQQTQISALNSDVQSLQSSQLQLQSDLIYSNSSLNTQIQNLNTQASPIDAKVIALASQTTNQYNQQQTELSNLDYNLVHNISTLNSTIQVQVQVLNTADYTLSSSLSALQSQFSSFTSTSTLNNTNQQNQIDSLQSTVSTQQSQLQLQSSDILQVNLTITFQLNTLQSSIIPFTSQVNNLDSHYSANYNNQQLTVSSFQTLDSSTIKYFNQLQVNFNNIVSTTNTLLQAEIQARINGDSFLQVQLNSIFAGVLNNKNLYLTTNSSVSSLANNTFINANQTYATKEEMNRYLCLKKPSHDYVGGICVLMCGSGATAVGEVCVCTNSSLVYTGGMCQSVCGAGAILQSGICVCTNSSLNYTSGSCQLLCGSGATAQAGICVCTNSSLVYTGGICQLVCGSGAVLYSGVCTCTNSTLSYSDGICQLICGGDAVLQSGVCKCPIQYRYDYDAQECIDICVTNVLSRLFKKYNCKIQQ